MTWMWNRYMILWEDHATTIYILCWLSLLINYKLSKWDKNLFFFMKRLFLYPCYQFCKSLHSMTLHWEIFRVLGHLSRDSAAFAHYQYIRYSLCMIFGWVVMLNTKFFHSVRTIFFLFPPSRSFSSVCGRVFLPHWFLLVSSYGN